MIACEESWGEKEWRPGGSLERSPQGELHVKGMEGALISGEEERTGVRLFPHVSSGV